MQSFEGEAVDELDSCGRTSCARPCWRARTGSADRCSRAGVTTDELAGLTLGEAPATPDRERLRSRRAELGLPAGDDAPLLVDAATGAAVGAEGLPLHLARTRLTRVSVEANSGVCRGLLRDRYPSMVGQGQTLARPDPP